MFKYVNKIKLKYQLASIIITSLIIIISVQVLFYFSFNVLTLERAEVYFTNLSQQIEGQVSSIIRSTEKSSKTISSSKLLNQYLGEYSALKKNEIYPFIDDFLNNEVEQQYTYDKGDSYEKHVININVISKNADVLSSNNDLYDFSQLIVNDYHINIQRYGSPFYTRVYYDQNLKSFLYAYIEPIFASKHDRLAENSIGTSIYFCNTDIYQDIIDKVNLPGNSVLILSDEKRKIFASNNKSLIGTSLYQKEIDIDQFLNKSQVMFNNQKCLSKALIIPQNKWKMVLLIPIADLVSDMKPIRNLGMVIGVFALFLLILIGIVFTSSIYSQISGILNGMKHIGKRDINFRIEAIGNNEIGTIASNINTMLDRIETMTRKIVSTQDDLYNMELLKKQAEINGLQSQINPHFLYNTLECIRSIAVSYGSEEIKIISTSMADIFRYSIKKDNIVTICEELECAKNYFEIISIRHSGKFSIQVSCDNSVLEKKIIKMVLQPLVENAVFHGLERKSGKGNLLISIYPCSGNIILIVKDDGIGMSTFQLKKLTNLQNTDNTDDNLKQKMTGSIGLLNINRRLKLTYGKNFGLSIKSSINVGTEVKLIIPEKD